MADNIWGLDVSGWQDFDYPLADFARQGCRFVIIKAGGSLNRDPQIKRHRRLADEAGVSYAIYYWFDPLVDAGRQVEHALRLKEEFQSPFIAADIEQWWANWDKWWDFTKGKRRKEEVPKLPPNTLSRFYYAVMERLTRATPALGYTGRWFVDEYMPEAWTWMKAYRWWIAAYPNNTKQRISWDELHKRLADYKARWQQDAIYGLRVPLKRETVLIWQVASAWILPGVKQRLDINLWLQDEATFDSSFQRGLAAPPAEPPKVRWDEMSAEKRWELVRRALVSLGILSQDGAEM